MICVLCQDSREVKVEKARTIGYTLTPGETIDEHLEPCPLCVPYKEEGGTMPTSCDLTQCSHNKDMKCTNDSLILKVFKCDTCATARVVCNSNDFRGYLKPKKKRGGKIENLRSTTKAEQRNKG